jgi:membrane protein
VLGATTVFGQMQHSLNGIWGVAARPNRSGLFALVKRRLLSLTVVLAIGFVLLVSLLLGVVLRAFLHFTHQFVPAVAALLSSAELLLSWLATSMLFAAIFKVLPDVVLRWRDVIVGALVTALLFSVGKFAIALYLTHTATASTYGAAGSVVLILLWVYYSSLILLFGAAFTKVQMLAGGGRVVPRNSAVRVHREQVVEAVG